MINQVTIGIPFSDNKMYVTVGFGKLVKSKKYKQWINDNIEIIKEGLVPAVNYPVKISLTVIKGWGFSEQNDTDNILKSICDILVRAEIIPDDSAKYVEGVEVKFLNFCSKRSESVTNILIIDSCASEV